MVKNTFPRMVKCTYGWVSEGQATYKPHMPPCELHVLDLPSNSSSKQAKMSMTDHSVENIIRQFQ